MKVIDASKDCLHCKIVVAIYDHYRAQQGAASDADVYLPIADISSNVGQVMAEFFAAQPEPRERKRRAREFHRAIVDAIPVIRARGDGAFPRMIKAQ